MGATFFCGSNAVLRREALMALSLTMFSRSAAERCAQAHDGRRRVRATVSVHLPGDIGSIIGRRAVRSLMEAERVLRRDGDPCRCHYDLRRQIASVAVRTCCRSRSSTRSTTPGVKPEVKPHRPGIGHDPIVTSSIHRGHGDGVRLHLGWAVSSPRGIAVCGLAPKDVRTMLSKSVNAGRPGRCGEFFSDRPLFLRGLTVVRRLMYLATMTSYLNGFAAVVLRIATFWCSWSDLPHQCDSSAFFGATSCWFFLCSQTLFVVASSQAGLWRGQRIVRPVPNLDQGHDL